MRTTYLELSDLLTIADHVVVGQALVRDHGLLESACARVRTTVFGADAYPTLAAKGAALVESLVRNHPLVDGNKGLGWMALYVFLGLNDVELEVDDDEAYDTVIGVAEGRLDMEATAALIDRWIT